MVEIDANLIEEALEDVLHGHAFGASKQCRALLQYIVKHTLNDQGNMLRERVIGAEVFGRAPDYDTGNDPVVRSRAAEVRKRLAQHYMREGESWSGVRIEIPSGSYRATFEVRKASLSRPEAMVAVWETESPVTREPVLPEPPSLEPVPFVPLTKLPAAWPRWRGILLVFAIAGILCIAVLWPFHHRTDATFDRFWGPVVNTPKSVVVYFGGTYSYHFSSQFLADYQSGHNLRTGGSALMDDIQNGTMLNERSLVPSFPRIGYGDVAAVARVVSTLTHLGKKYDLRYGSDITVTDLHASPTVLIGGFSNMWTLQLMHDFRYTLEQGGIVDRQQQKLIWRQSTSADGLRNEDYVVISRIPNSATGSFTLFIAGLNTYSNQAAADFISDPEKIRAITRSLQGGWEKKNIQIVLHTSVIDQVPIAADVVAVHSW